MKRWVMILVVVAAALFTQPARAHVGSPNVFFEGHAGPYPVHVVIHPAEVIPGLAELSIRIDAENIKTVTALPIKWNAGRMGAPPPDIAKPVRGDPGLYSAQLWFMEPGAQSVELEVQGPAGAGRVVIPVDAVATRVLALPKALGVGLAVLGLILGGLLISIVGSAVRESVLTPGSEPTPTRRLYALGGMGLGTVLLVALVWGGKNWWDAEAADYKNNRLYHPISAKADVRTNGDKTSLLLAITDPAFARTAPLVPDHGKLMHLFLVREPGLNCFAHLHPVKLDRASFDVALPKLPAGLYRLYADITYETGLSDTLTCRVTIPEVTTGATEADPDDSATVAPPMGRCDGTSFPLSQDYVMTRTGPERCWVNQPTNLHFVVHDSRGKEVSLETYLGMRGHLALTREDGAVFTHLHPGGTASMAAMQLATYRIEGKLPLKAAFGADEPICQLPAASSADQGWIGGNPSAEGVSFPYAFPKPGRYRLWVQVKIEGGIQTGVFDIDVDGA